MLFLGGRRELAGPPTVAEAVGEGLEVDMMSRELGDCIRSKILYCLYSWNFRISMEGNLGYVRERSR